MGSTAAIDRTDKLRGIFTMRVIDRDGNILSEYEDHNMIVNGSKIAMTHLISDITAGQDYVITDIGFGTVGTEPSVNDTKLYGYLTKLPITKYEYKEDTDSNTNRVCFDWVLGYDNAECNNKALAEFGLFTKNSTLFARKRRDAITKDDSIQFEGTWTIIF